MQCRQGQALGFSSLVLDLNAVFETVDHTIILGWLNNLVGISGTVINWLTSYLTVFIHMEEESSKDYQLNCGVPQGSILGPLYVFRKHGISFRGYADDIKLYIANDLFDFDLHLIIFF